MCLNSEAHDSASEGPEPDQSTSTGNARQATPRELSTGPGGTQGKTKRQAVYDGGDRRQPTPLPRPATRQPHEGAEAAVTMLRAFPRRSSITHPQHTSVGLPTDALDSMITEGNNIGVRGRQRRCENIPAPGHYPGGEPRYVDHRPAPPRPHHITRNNLEPESPLCHGRLDEGPTGGGGEGLREAGGKGGCCGIKRDLGPHEGRAPRARANAANTACFSLARAGLAAATSQRQRWEGQGGVRMLSFFPPPYPSLAGPSPSPDENLKPEAAETSVRWARTNHRNSRKTPTKVRPDLKNMSSSSWVAEK